MVCLPIFVTESVGIALARATLGDEEVREMVKEMDSERRLALIERHPNQAKGIMGLNE